MSNKSADKVFTAAVIGTGRIGMLMELDSKRLKPASHFGMWHSHPRFNLAAICDNEPSKFDVARSFDQNIQCFDDPEKLIAEISPDVISISTWRDTHYEIMKLALKHNIPAIVCEKPIAEQKEHAEEVVEEAKSKGIHLLVNHRRRFDPLLRSFKSDLESGLLGDILQVHSTYVFGLLSTGTHLVDTLRMLFTGVAGDVKWVSAYPATFSSYHPDDDPNLDGVICFENGLKASVQSLSMKDYDNFDFHIYGRLGKGVFKSIGRTIELYKVIESAEHEGFTELEDSPSEVRGGKPRDLFGSLANNVADCLEGKATSLSTGEDSLIALDVLLAMKKSAAEGGIRIEI